MATEVLVDSGIADKQLRDAVLEALETSDGIQSLLAGPPAADRLGDPVSELTVVVLITSGLALWVSDIFYRIRQRFRPMIVLDLRGDIPKVSIHEEVPGMRGEVFVQHKTGEEVKIIGPDSSAELAGELLKAIGGGTE